MCMQPAKVSLAALQCMQEAVTIAKTHKKKASALSSLCLSLSLSLLCPMQLSPLFFGTLSPYHSCCLIFKHGMYMCKDTCIHVYVCV